MNHGKKMIAPVVIAIIFITYYIGIAVFIIRVPDISGIVRVLLVVIPLILAAVMFGVLISRIKEIQGGEEDDLSQY